jgi:hypothetical protein
MEELHAVEHLIATDSAIPILDADSISDARSDVLVGLGRFHPRSPRTAPNRMALSPKRKTPG